MTSPPHSYICGNGCGTTVAAWQKQRDMANGNPKAAVWVPPNGRVTLTPKPTQRKICLQSLITWLYPPSFQKPLAWKGGCGGERDTLATYVPVSPSSPVSPHLDDWLMHRAADCMAVTLQHWAGRDEAWRDRQGNQSLSLLVKSPPWSVRDTLAPRSILVAGGNEQPHNCSRKELFGAASLAPQGRKYYLNVE